MFRTGLRQLPSDLLRQFYIAKMASRDCILSRVATNLREIDALEKTRSVLLEIQKHDKGILAAANQELTVLKEVADIQCSDIEQDIAFRHAVYADELTALTASNMQLNHMLDVSEGLSSGPEVTDSEPESECGAMETTEHDGSYACMSLPINTVAKCLLLLFV